MRVCVSAIFSQSLSLSFSPSLSVSLSLFFSTSLSFSLCLYLSVCLPFYRPISLSLSRPLPPSLSPSPFPSLSLNGCLYLYLCLFLYPVSFRASKWKRKTLRAFPFFRLEKIKGEAKQVCETSLSFGCNNVKNEGIPRDFLNFRTRQHQKRSNAATLPSKTKSGVLKWRLCGNAFYDFVTPFARLLLALRRHKALGNTQRFATFLPFRGILSFFIWLLLFWCFLFSDCSHHCCCICP